MKGNTGLLNHGRKILWLAVQKFWQIDGVMWAGTFAFVSSKMARSLSGLENRSENLRNRDQIFMDLRRIAGLFNEKPWKYGSIYQVCSRFMSKSDRLLERETKARHEEQLLAVRSSSFCDVARFTD